jgi:hypothetical protein
MSSSEGDKLSKKNAFLQLHRLQASTTQLTITDVRSASERTILMEGVEWQQLYETILSCLMIPLA